MTSYIDMFSNMDRSQISAWYEENVGYDIVAEDPTLDIEEYRQLCRDFNKTLNEMSGPIETSSAATKQNDQAFKEPPMLTSSDVQACSELVEWWNTGILNQNGVLAKLAAEHLHAPGDTRAAERDLVERVVRAIASGGTNLQRSVVAEAGASFPQISDTSWRSEHPYIVTLKNGQTTVAYPIAGYQTGDCLKIGASMAISERCWELVDHFFESDLITHVGASRLVTPDQVTSWSVLSSLKKLDAVACSEHQSFCSATTAFEVFFESCMDTWECLNANGMGATAPIAEAGYTFFLSEHEGRMDIVAVPYREISSPLRPGEAIPMSHFDNKEAAELVRMTDALRKWNEKLDAVVFVDPSFLPSRI